MIVNDVGQALVIEDPASIALATELAQLTGESVDAAVAQAVLERLKRERGERDRRAEVEARVARIMALTDVIAGQLEPGTTSDTSWLYDENGLPR